MDYQHQQKLQTAVEKIHQAIPEIIAIVIFGSYGTQYEKNSSDLDIAILAEKKISKIFLWKLAQEIAIKINRDVDLIDLRQASTVFKFHILTSGQLIDCANVKSFAFFETEAYSMYLHFQETRKEILEGYRGSYG